MSSFRFKYPDAIQIKRKVQVALKAKPQSWNGKAEYESFCKSLEEQGFCLKVAHDNKILSIAWANLAGAIVVYSGTGEFTFPGNVPDVTADKKMSPTTDLDAVASHIVQLVENFLK